MQIKYRYAVLLIGVGLPALAIVSAPVTIAAGSSDNGPSQQSCVQLGRTEVKCDSPGDEQLYDSPPQVDLFPYAGGAT
ncbi:hypothetical protein ABFW14_07205 [Mycolicibacterium fortuitum]|uniref:hypothetical protein n=1 Tax=Mycolicibacterium fortuitum TaxID=1766 RepID=UPI0007ED39A0|nr:hypothetical protein [Mycolicibacterium fortuitum]NOP99985.1 hypothetical protein [Mycolicibacterium fortuitum]OBK05211.1 hypothetical protein A5637_10545 [Mycolicibacterium fortuitum]